MIKDLKFEILNLEFVFWLQGKGNSIAFLGALKRACCRGKSYSPVSQGLFLLVLKDLLVCVLLCVLVSDF